MLVPGNVNPLLLALAGDPLDEYGKIDRSLRFRSGATPFLSRTPSVAGNGKTIVFAAWIRRTVFGVTSQILSVQQSGVADDCIGFIGDALVFALNDGYTGYVAQTAMFRDISEFMDVVIAVDTSQAIAANRVRIYINGQLQTLQANTIPLNYVMTGFNTLRPHVIGRYAPGSLHFDGNIAHYAFIDGYPTGVTNANWSSTDFSAMFGLFHPRTGQWRPKPKVQLKSVVDAGGVNSCFLPFDNTSSLSTLCADSSVKGNNWVATNISLTPGVTYDSMTDTPTNCFPVIDANFAANGFSPGNITDGGLKFSSSATYHFTPCTIPLPAYGKWYAEFIPQDTVSFIGVADLDNGPGASQNIGGGYGWYGNVIYTGNASAVIGSLPAMAANDIIGVAVDMTIPQVQWYKNGTLVATQALSSLKRYAFACGDYYAPGATSCYANFGQRPLSYLPSGYKTLCTKNLALPKIAKSSSAFVSVADSGANIAAKLAAARAGWSGYIDIIKRRDAAEGWRWIFSDDPGYYLDSSAVAAKAAVPAFGGTAYVGYSLKVSALNGVATGRLIHTTGVADTVSDGLGSIRKAIILVSEAGSNWFFYHPELTAGKLLYLNSTSPETTDPTIGSVTASGFTVAASIPTGTYRWIAIEEIEGFTKLGKYAGNSSTDGPSNYCLESPAFNAVKVISGYTNDWINWDSAREKANVQNSGLFFNSNAPESVAASEQIDALGNGFKLRSSSSRVNLGGMYVYLSIAAFPFRYANAR